MTTGSQRTKKNNASTKLGGKNIKSRTDVAGQQSLNFVFTGNLRTPFPSPTWHNILLPAHTVPELTDRNCAARQRRGELESHSHLS